MIYEIKSDSFVNKDIFDCGQCFRWNEEDDGSYTGVFHNIVLNVENSNGKIIFRGISKDKNYTQTDFEKDIRQSFDLDRDYLKLKSTLSKVDNNLAEAIKYGEGIRLLNQDLFETIISFITSANNNIPRIKSLVEKLCAKYGEEIIFEGKKYYTFPSIENLSTATQQDLRGMGFGFRDKYIFKTVQYLKENPNVLKDIYNKDTDSARKDLLSLQGIGPKVADCILLFSDLKRLDVFPIDVWVRRVSKKEINNIADEKFGEYKGLAQQYLFYWKRENND